MGMTSGPCGTPPPPSGRCAGVPAGTRGGGVAPPAKAFAIAAEAEAAAELDGEPDAGADADAERGDVGDGVAPGGVGSLTPVGASSVAEPSAARLPAGVADASGAMTPTPA